MMQIFYALVEQTGESAWGVRFPDVPGCFSASDSEGALLSDACDALACHLQGIDFDANDLDSVRRAVAEDLAEGAFLLAVPYLDRRAPVKRVNISVTENLLNAIDAAAAVRKMTRSAFIAYAARNEIRGR